MNNILLIATYEDLQKTAQEVVREKGFEVDIVSGNLYNGASIAEQAEKNGIEVIITRGGTYQIARRTVEIPVVEIQVNAFDILRAFKNLMDYKGPIGIVGHENVVFGAQTLRDVLKLDLHEVIFKSGDDAPRKVFEVAARGIKKFVGDAIGIKTVRDMGLEGYLVQSGREAVLSSIEEAYRVVEARKYEREKAERFKVIMDFIHDGIIAVDDKGNITIFNKMAESIFNTNEILTGKNIVEVVENTKLLDVLKTGKSQIGELQQIRNVVIATNRVPVIVDGKINGAVATFQDVTQIQRIEQKIRRDLHSKGLVAKYNFNDIVYKSDIMGNTIEQAKKYAALNSTTVLVLGETGTGKELLVHSIHNASPRANGPFVAINCAALPENLLESELFGYAEGAFTGARKGGKMGLFELAHRGTIFLDEIGDMPLNLQSRLLRVLQEKEVMRIGDDRVIPVDVRIIASTNRDLREDAENGKFRTDLFYRLNILTLTVPSLRQRREDIPILVKAFVKMYSERLGKHIEGISKEAEGVLDDLEYRGNVRELKGLIERSVAFAEDRFISVKDLGHINYSKCDNAAIPHKGMTLKQIESMAIKEALKDADNNISKAAKMLGVDRTTLWRKMKEV